MISRLFRVVLVASLCVPIMTDAGVGAPSTKAPTSNSVSGASKPAKTLCETDEEAVFNCSTGRKVISVCAARDLKADRGYIQYRFGPPAKVELAVPANRSVRPAASAVAGELMFSGGGGAYLRFNAAGYDYVVYTAIGKGWGQKDGVAIEKAGKLVSHVVCVDNPASRLGPDFSTKAGLTADTKDFDLP